MKRKKNRFMGILESYITEYMPCAAGLSDNTIRSYKDTFRLLLAYLHEEKGISACEAAFAGLDYDTLTSFLVKCTPLSRQKSKKNKLDR